ncbi:MULTISPECIES: VIT family protein [unclassified Cryobacterium]|uniref:VIT1/CCC1 transporter family protein n=1 Tax=unclassified Cryobacterium TaxID=2649013 RepID=UPI002AB54A2A|nr:MULTISPECIES: VIT family protein [Cryobacterium]MDY7529980.1 VIT family protein [Cryobacterium sp. 10C2]MDY7557883.1 VIT family protein [Cryobacterium sp. 10C3]MEB0002511.1 VIT family protein [Cryobacterium sp. RTC2.1]MEB0292063.1 VIT family protein [Cryobacterium sp. 10C2]MEB0304795.1 VIT family protein [Cryobacterium sp. 10I1]
MSDRGKREPLDSHPDEPHQGGGLSTRLNWLRAGVLGANDGIVSVAAIVVGVAGATHVVGPILTAGVAALMGGAVSMALGEYVSVSSQRDSEQALIATEKRELAETPEQELEELAGMHQARGLSPETARQVAGELTEHDALAAHLAIELNIDENDVASPWNAALASAVAFICGGIIPLAAILLPPDAWRVPVTFLAVLLVLAISGALAGHLGGSSRGRATFRMVLGGALALLSTFAIGLLLGSSGTT